MISCESCKFVLNIKGNFFICNQKNSKFYETIVNDHCPQYEEKLVDY